MSEAPRQAELTALENALSALAPAPVSIDRDRLMFQAGQESMRPWRLLWPTATAASLLLAMVFATLLAMRTPPVQVVYLPAEPPPAEPSPASRDSLVSTQPVPSLAESSYGKLREQLMRHGIDALPMPGPLPPARPDDTINRFRDL